MNRRSFVAGGVVGAATIAFSVIRVATASPAPVAKTTGTGAAADTAPMADMAGMNMAMVDPTIHSFDYQGHSVRITESADAAMLVIDGRHSIHLERPDIGQYHTHLLPFNTYTDSRLLVRDVLNASASHLFII